MPQPVPAEGDRAALGAMLTEVGPAVLGAVRATLGATHAELEDVVQESLLAFVAALPSFRGECTLMHFARRIAVRRAIDALRSSHRAERARAELCESTQPMEEPRGMVEQRRHKWRALLAELPTPQAEALWLRAVDGCTVEEIATLTEAPVETVRSRLRLAKTAIQKRMAHDPTLADLMEDAHAPS